MKTGARKKMSDEEETVRLSFKELSNLAKTSKDNTGKIWFYSITNIQRFKGPKIVGCAQP